MHSPASLHLAFLPLKWHDPQVCLIQCLSDPIISQTCHKILTWPRHLLVIFQYLVWLSFCSSLLWKLRDNSREEFAVLSLKPWSDVVKIPIYLTWTISNDLMFQPKTWTIRWIPGKSLSWCLHFTHKRSQPFFIFEGKTESFGSVSKATKGFLQTNKQTERMNYTKESRFFERPREMKVGLKNRKFEDSKVL